MRPFDEVVAVDWSAAGAPKTGADSIWIATGSGMLLNPATRIAATDRLRGIMREALTASRRTLIVFDFALGGPAGLAARVTGRPWAPALWDWLAKRHEDDAGNRTNYRRLAARMNRVFEGDGPFWGNGQKADIPDLPRRKPRLPAGLVAHRRAELAGQERGLSPKTLWQLAGAGAVGAQSLTGMAMLSGLCAEFGTDLAVWPFHDRPDATLVVAETYLSLLPDETARRMRTGAVRDAAQAGAIADAFLNLSRQARIEPLFHVDAPDHVLVEEGWYLGAGRANLVQSAFD